MRYMFSVFLTALCQRLHSVKSWLALLLLPLLIFGISGGRETDMSAPVTVGVVLPESCEEELWALLDAYNGDILSFVATDEQTIDRNVAAGKWDCGLVFSSDFSERLEEGDLDRSIVLRIGPGSTVYPLVQETVSACVAQLASPVIAREYLVDNAMADREQNLEQRLEQLRSQTRRIGITVSTLEGTALLVPELNRHGRTQFLSWLVCAVILVRMLFGSADLNKWITSGAVKRLQPLRSGLSMLAARAGAEGVLMALSGCLAILLLGRGFWGCLAVLEYTLFWTALSILLALLPRTHSILPVCLPFALIISFLLSSALVDISVLFPSLSGISRWMPGAVFLRVCRGDTVGMPVLPIFFLACCLLSWLVWTLTRKAFQNRSAS